MNEILILGGYGNFGKRIAAALTRHGASLIISGRNENKATALAGALGQRALAFDIAREFEAVLEREKPSVVVHTAGPFQGADYKVARACIAAGAHYVDLADGRDFVGGITALDEAAKVAGVTAVSGASTVPGLSSAVVEHFLPEFARLETMDFGISPGQKAERGLATTRAIMSYVGKPLRPFAGHPQPYGWQDLHSQDYPIMGRRWLSVCDIPDLDLLPARYGLSSIRFGAGLELGALHLGVSLAAALVKAGLPLDLPALAGPLLQVSDWFNPLGSDTGGMHVILGGSGHDGRPLTRRWFIVAEKGDGPQIPCVPAILLARRLHEKSSGLTAGAFPCVGLISLEDYLEELKPFAIRTY